MREVKTMSRPVRKPKVHKLKIAQPKLRQLDTEEIAAALGAEVSGKKTAGPLARLPLFQRRGITELFRSIEDCPTLLDKKVQKIPG